MSRVRKKVEGTRSRPTRPTPAHNPRRGLPPFETNCFEQSGTPGGEQSQSTQIKFMRLRIVRAINDKWLAGAARELDAQFARDRLGNFILDLKNIVEFAIVLLRPRL